MLKSNDARFNIAHAFMCNIEEKLENQNKMPVFYKRYVDDTLSKMPDV